MQFVIHLLAFVVPCWGINIALNLWYLLKLRRPSVLAYDAPLDLNKNFFDGYRILGDSTTWVGLPVAVIAGISIELFLTSVLVGTVKGLSVYFGHSIGSFIKRRFNIPRGKFVPIVDHGDSIIITGAVFYFLGWQPLSIVTTAVLLTLAVQPILAYGGYKLKLRDNPL